MVITVEKNASKRGKQDTTAQAHKKNINSMFQAHRLEGKVKNVGIKNIGHQKKKSKAD
ncbi:MAG: hypothetical protein Q8O53_03215 [Candidatus Moranbacteria bacterium]|nr:hypothetical protein [Candidatus Moranbacteria bacterium]